MDSDSDNGDIGLVNAATYTPATKGIDRSNRPPHIVIRRASSASPISPISPTGQRHRDVPELGRSLSLPRLKSGPKNIHTAPLDAPSLDDDTVFGLRRWIVCFALVNFDLDIGPVAYGVYPFSPLAPADKENICFSSFPDSAQFSEGTEEHSFRIRLTPISGQGDWPKSSEPFGGTDFLYGFAQFSRKHNPESARGYEQHSVVILTRHPWPSLFRDLVSRLGPMYLEHGGPMLEAACHNIAHWYDLPSICPFTPLKLSAKKRPDPSPGSTVELGFLGDVFNVELPTHAAQQQSVQEAQRNLASPSIRLIFASVAPSDPPIISLFTGVLSHMWSIWECLILGEPLIVFGPSPAATSQAVWWMVDILKPIPFAGDFRPFFTINDKDYSMFVGKSLPKQGLILGVTNPFFENMCKHWPHALHVHPQLQSLRPTSHQRSPSTGNPSMWHTKNHNRYISKDKTLLKRLQEMAVSPRASEASQLMHHHFSGRTLAFLAPLNRYLNTLIPSPAEVASLSGSVPRLKPFNHAKFFESLKTHGSPLPFRTAARRKEFYERWLRSPAFGGWMSQQETTVQQLLRRR